LQLVAATLICAALGGGLPPGVPPPRWTVPSRLVVPFGATPVGLAGEPIPCAGRPAPLPGSSVLPGAAPRRLRGVLLSFGRGSEPTAGAPECARACGNGFAVTGLGCVAEAPRGNALHSRANKVGLIRIDGSFPWLAASGVRRGRRSLPCIAPGVARSAEEHHLERRDDDQQQDWANEHSS